MYMHTAKVTQTPLQGIGVSTLRPYVSGSKSSTRGISTSRGGKGRSKGKTSFHALLFIAPISPLESFCREEGKAGSGDCINQLH